MVSNSDRLLAASFALILLTGCAEQLIVDPFTVAHGCAPPYEMGVRAEVAGRNATLVRATESACVREDEGIVARERIVTGPGRYGHDREQSGQNSFFVWEYRAGTHVNLNGR